MIDSLTYHLNQQRSIMRLGEEVDRIEPVADEHGEYVKIHLVSGKPITTDMALYSIGCTGATRSLNIEAASLETDERGIKLSGGERQRLAFGRVFIQDPKIVVMDEPTSALDSLTESFVTQNMTHLFKGKAVIIIAHRLQSVKDADQIFVLENGQVIQQGSFETLVMTEGKFRQLWETQTTRRSEKRATR